MTERQSTEKVFVDTNILLDYAKDIFDNYDNVIICDVVLEEIDKLKHFGKTEEQKEKANKVTDVLENNESKYEYIIGADGKDLPEAYDIKINDNKILDLAVKIQKSGEDIIILTNDLNMGQKCKSLNLKREKINDKNSSNGYKGYIKLDLTTKEVNNLYEDLENGINTYDLLENQYLIINKEGNKKPIELRYSNGELVKLNLPESQKIKGMNSQQRFVLDLLNNHDVPIKIIAGEYGSGKTLLATKMGIHHIFDKGNYGKMLLIRNPLGSGEEIGFVTGDKQDKTKDFFRCVDQYIDLPDDEKSQEYIEKDIPFYIKGISYGSTYLLVDEAEDMDLRILKLIGSRIEEDSCVVFCGDYNQAEPKYKKDNGFYQLIEGTKGHKDVGIVVLDECVRSRASKVFAKL